MALALPVASLPSYHLLPARSIRQRAPVLRTDSPVLLFDFFKKPDAEEKADAGSMDAAEVKKLKAEKLRLQVRPDVLSRPRRAAHCALSSPEPLISWCLSRVRRPK